MGLEMKDEDRDRGWKDIRWVSGVLTGSENRHRESYHSTGGGCTTGSSERYKDPPLPLRPLPPSRKRSKPGNEYGDVFTNFRTKIK